MREYRDTEIGSALLDLPTPPPPAGFFEVLHTQLADATNRRSRSRGRFVGTRRGWMNRRSVVTAVAVASSLIVGGIAGAVLAIPSRGATPPPVPAFQPTLGWNTVETNVTKDPNHLSVAWAANVPFQPQDKSGDGFPTATVTSLPTNGIVVAIVGPWTYTGTDRPRQLQFPLQLSQMNFNGSNYEGQIAPNVSQYAISGLLQNGQIVNVYVWMGTPQPNESMIDAADQELTHITMPS